MGLKVNQKLYNSISDQKKKLAIEFLRCYLKDKEIIKMAIQIDPECWFAPYHFNWGMAIRNGLRCEGFGESYFEIDNLDDIYVELVEETVKEKNNVFINSRCL